MNKLAVATFTTVKQDAPEGIEVGGFTVTLMSGETTISSQDVANLDAPVSFEINAPGKYFVTAVRVAIDGTAVSPVVASEEFELVLAQIDVPATITVTLSDITPTIDVPATAQVDVQ